jgi:tetratricopeptide (TPR) repeat protein
MADSSGPQQELELALGCFNEALGLIDKDKDPGYYGIILHDIADAQVAAGNLPEAVTAYREAMTFKLRRLPAHPGDLATTMEALCDCLIDCGELTEARATLSKLADILPQIARADERAIHLHGVGRAYERLAGAGLPDAYPEALQAYTAAAELVDHDKDPGFYGVIMHDIGDTQLASGKAREAAAAYREAMTYKRRRVPAQPGDLAATMLALTDCLLDTGEYAEARTVLDELTEIAGQISEPSHRAARLRHIGSAYKQLAEAGQADAYPAALTAFTDALLLVDSVADSVTYATLLNETGSIFKAQGQYEQARDAYERAVDHMRRNPDGRYQLASMLVDLGRIRLQILSQQQQEEAPLEESHPEDDATEPPESDPAASPAVTTTRRR